VRAARLFDALLLGGILNRTVSQGVCSRADKKAKAFREFFDRKSAAVHDVPAGTFKSAGCSAGTKFVLIQAS